jgi:linoleoyl-CoA desaturase
MSKRETFAAELHERSNEYLAADGRLSGATMVIKTVVLCGIYAGAYALILTELPSLSLMWMLCVAMGVAMAGIGFSVSHDALHGAYSSNPRVNRYLGWSFDALGASSYLWKLTHNRIHHIFTNIRGVDEDLEVSPLLRLSPYTPQRPVHRFQHLYAIFAYALTTLYWIFAKDYMYFFRADIGPYRGKRHPWSAWAALFGGKALYYLCMIVLPLLVLDLAWWQFAIGFLTVHVVGGFILGIVFQLAHVVEETDQFPSGDGAKSRSQWIEDQLRTTNDFAPDNRLLTWYVGGLNFQVEHHLFPRVCHVHYPALRRIVVSVAAKHGIPYHCHPTLLAAVRSHLRQLRKLAGTDPLPAPATAAAH